LSFSSSRVFLFASKGRLRDSLWSRWLGDVFKIQVRFNAKFDL